MNSHYCQRLADRLREIGLDLFRMQLSQSKTLFFLFNTSMTTLQASCMRFRQSKLGMTKARMKRDAFVQLLRIDTQYNQMRYPYVVPSRMCAMTRNLSAALRGLMGQRHQAVRLQCFNTCTRL